jgi:hypothetical protein
LNVVGQNRAGQGDQIGGIFAYWAIAFFVHYWSTEGAHIFRLLFYTATAVLILTQNGSGCSFGDFFTNSSGPMLWFLKYFRSNYWYFCKHLIITLVFEKNANCFRRNWQKSLKIVIITSTPGAAQSFSLSMCPNILPGPLILSLQTLSLSIDS